MISRSAPPFSPDTVHGKLVVAGVCLFVLDFIVFVGAVVFGPGYVAAHFQNGAELPPAIGLFNVAVFLIAAMGFCLIVSGLSLFIHETGGVNHETHD